MKIKKFREKLQRKSGTDNEKKNEQQITRVTNDAVAAHRDEVLSKGRKFKYPFQKSKRRVVLVSVSLVLIALLLTSILTGLRLYIFQDSGELTYRITQVVPFPVARVNGTFTSYESYLFELRSSLHWQTKYGTTDLQSPDGQRQVSYLKRQSLDKALINTITEDLADKNHISVTSNEVNTRIARIKAFGGNLEQILNDQYRLSEADLRRAISSSILKAKVSKQLDKDAPRRAQQVLSELKGGKQFADVAKTSSEDPETKQIGGSIGVVERNHTNLPSEVAEKIFQLKPGETSDIIETAADYYIVHINQKVDENRYDTSVIKINAKDIAEYLKEYRDQKKVSEYIKIPSAESKQSQ